MGQRCCWSLIALPPATAGSPAARWPPMNLWSGDWAARGDAAYSAEVVVRLLLVLKHARNRSYAVLKREERANLIDASSPHRLCQDGQCQDNGANGAGRGTQRDQADPRAKRGYSQGETTRVDTTVVETNYSLSHPRMRPLPYSCGGYPCTACSLSK